MVTVVGYARISRSGSKSVAQERELTVAGASRVFVDRIDSTRIVERPEWATCLRSLQRGDTLLIRSLDRIASCETMAVEVITELHRRGIKLRSIREPDVDTGASHGPELIEFAAVLGRLREKAEPADDAYSGRFRRVRGRVKGRPPVMTPERLSAARCLRKQGHTVARIAALLGVGVTTIITTFAGEAKHEP